MRKEDEAGGWGRIMRPANKEGWLGRKMMQEDEKKDEPVRLGMRMRHKDKEGVLYGEIFKKEDIEKDKARGLGMWTRWWRKQIKHKDNELGWGKRS